MNARFKAIIFPVSVAFVLIFLSIESLAEPFAYITNYGDNNVSVIDTATNSVIDTIAVGSGPMAFGKFIRPPWDIDGDGLSDEWEITYFGNINQEPAGDDDGDGLTNLEEYQLLTDPTTPNTSTPSNPLPVGGGGGGGGACFIATAVYGSALSNEVNVLKKFRDRYLLTNELGKDLVSAYYKYSPPLADFISEHPVIRKIVRIGLYPVLELSRWIIA